MAIKELTKVYQTADGKVFATMAEAEQYEEVELRRYAIGVLRDYAKYNHGVKICASGIDQALARFGFVFDPSKFDKREAELVEKLAARAQGAYPSEAWTGRPDRYRP